MKTSAVYRRPLRENVLAVKTSAPLKRPRAIDVRYLTMSDAGKSSGAGHIEDSTKCAFEAIDSILVCHELCELFAERMSESRCVNHVLDDAVRVNNVATTSLFVRKLEDMILTRHSVSIYLSLNDVATTCLFV